MKKSNFPVLACFIGAFLFVVLLKTGVPGPDSAFPLLTLLFMTELGFLVTGVGAVYGVKLQIDNGFDVKLLLATLACVALAVALAIKGVAYWGSMNA